MPEQCDIFNIFTNNTNFRESLGTGILSNLNVSLLHFLCCGLAQMKGGITISQTSSSTYQRLAEALARRTAPAGCWQSRGAEQSLHSNYSEESWVFCRGSTRNASGTRQRGACYSQLTMRRGVHLLSAQQTAVCFLSSCSGACVPCCVHLCICFRADMFI